MLFNWLEKTLESPLNCKDTQPVHPTGDPSWVLIGRTDVEAKTPILWPPDAKSWLIGKDPDAGKDWGQEKGMTEDEMVGWHQRLNEHEYGYAPRVGDGQRDLACCVYGVKKSQTRVSHWNELTWINHRYTYVSPSQTTLPILSHPSVYPSAPALSALFHASNLDWSSISHMVIYMIQCYSLKSFHPRLLPQSSKVCSLYLCLFCCLTYRVIVTIFLNSIYMC